MSLTNKPTVATPSREHLASATAWRLPRALMGGTRAMRAAGKAYLPQEPGESDAAYNIRLGRSTLFNAFRKTIRDMSGKVFRKPIALGADMPAELAADAENIDLAGRDLNQFALAVLRDALQAGISFIYVDMPLALPEGATRADEIASNRRPYLVHIPAERLLGWKSATVGGREMLTQVRIEECVSEPNPDNPWEDIERTQVRVLYPGVWEIWRKNSKDEWYLHDAGPSSLPHITLVPVYANRTGFMTGAPPLEDLADINVAHWQSSSDQRSILHIARLPIGVISGVATDSNNKITLGPNAWVTIREEGAKVYFVEHGGQAIGAGREDLKDLEFQMQALGLELLLPKPGNDSATGAAIDQAVMNAPLAIIALGLKDALEEAFGFMGEYRGMGEDAAGELTVNTDFGISMRDAADLTTLLNAVNAGHITRETFLKELIRRGVLADDIDPEVELEKLETAPMNLLGESLELPGDTAGDTSGTESGTGVPTPQPGDGVTSVMPGPTLDEIRTLIETAVGAIEFPEPPPPAEPQPIVVNVAPPAVNVAAPDVTVTVDAKEGRTITTVLEKDEQGGIRRFVREPAPAETGANE